MFICLFVNLPLVIKKNKKMDSTRIIELISYTLPTIIMAFVAYSFFELYTKNENNNTSTIYTFTGEIIHKYLELIVKKQLFK